MVRLSISKSKLQEMIRQNVRSSIREQVVGYSAPSEDEEKDQADDYLTVGQTSMAAAPDSHAEKEAADTSTRELTQQRQSQLNKDDAVTADDTGRQLQDLLDQKNEGTVRLTKRQLRKAIREACGLEGTEPQVQELPQMMPPEPIGDAVPVPEDYNSVRDFLEMNPEIVDMSINTVMDMAGAGCERSTAQGIIDHLQDMVSPAQDLGVMDMMVGIEEAYQTNNAFYGPGAANSFENPHLADSYSGNGHVPAAGFKALIPAMEEIGDPLYEPAIGITQESFSDKGHPLYYIPFIYGDKVLVSLQKVLDSGEAPGSLTQEMIDQAGWELNDEDHEHSPPGW